VGTGGECNERRHAEKGTVDIQWADHSRAQLHRVRQANRCAVPRRRGLYGHMYSARSHGGLAPTRPDLLVETDSATPGLLAWGDCRWIFPNCSSERTPDATGGIPLSERPRCGGCEELDAA